MCMSCSSKENLKLPIPDNIDQDLFLEYVERRNYLDEGGVFRYFIKIYNVEYVENPKQIRRAIVNMDQIFYLYKSGNLIFNPPLLTQDQSKTGSDTLPQPKVKTSKK
jgi:hypothetical protein